MGNGFFINRSLEEYEMDSLMIQLEYLLKHRKIQSQIANIWRKTRSKEKYQQERFLLFRSLAPLYAPLFSAKVFLKFNRSKKKSRQENVKSNFYGGIDLSALGLENPEDYFKSDS